MKTRARKESGVKYTAAEQRAIKALEIYEDRPGRKGRPRANRRGQVTPDGFVVVDAVGVHFQGNGGIVYRAEGPRGQVCLVRAWPGRFQKVGLEELVKADEALVYIKWTGILSRCYSPNHTEAKGYYGKGVEVYRGWRPAGRRDLGGTIQQRREAFEAFKRWAEKDFGGPLVRDERGFAPEISRNRDLGDYEPGNVRILTLDEHAAETAATRGWKRRAA